MLAGCGGLGSNSSKSSDITSGRFEQHGFEITFRYPQSLKNADDLNFLGLQRGISGLGERARNKKLKPEEVEGSTFTITNPGQFGAVFGLPIINQPNSAIMGVGGITKAPVVISDSDGNDSIAIRSLVHLTLGYDHRLIDGAVADQFMALVKKTLENWSEEVG